MKKRITILIILIVIIFLVFSVIFYFILKKPADNNINIQTITLDVSGKDGRKIIVHLGDILALSLIADSKTGNEWHYAGPLGDELEMIKHEVKPIYDKKLMAGDIQSIWKFKVAKVGNFELKFNYAGGWEEKVAKTFKVQIESKPPR